MSDPKPTGPHTKLSTILIPTYPVKILQSRCTERAASQHTPCRTRSTPSRTPSSLPPTQPPQDTQPQKGAGPPLTKSSSPPPPTTITVRQITITSRQIHDLSHVLLHYFNGSRQTRHHFINYRHQALLIRGLLREGATG